MAKKKFTAFAVIVAILLIICCVIGGYLFVQKDINGSRSDDIEYTLVVSNGEYNYEVASDLKNNNIIYSDTVFGLWLDKNYPQLEIEAGEYYVNSNMTYTQIAEKLSSPDISHKVVSVCIPEGYDIFDIATTLEENEICSYDDFLDACKSASDYDYEFLSCVPDDENIAYELEGFLFPATYDLAKNSQAYNIVCNMLEAFEYRITDSWTTYCSENDITLYELITLASIVEKETLGDGVAENIASVFINRLNIGQQLQSDVTIYYGNDLRDNGFSDNVVSSYNTYKCSALPSGPVCNPGEANINAVINHSDTDYYYFFSDLNNEFHFAKDYDEFESLKAQYPWE